MPKANKEGMKRIQQSRSNNSTLASLEDLQSILDFADRNVGTFNCVNFSTAVHRLGKLNKPFKRGGGGARGGRDRGGRVAAVVPVNEDPRFHRLLEAIEAELVLHPRSPILTSESRSIQLTFASLFVLVAAGAGWTAWHFLGRRRKA